MRSWVSLRMPMSIVAAGDCTNSAPTQILLHWSAVARTMFPNHYAAACAFQSPAVRSDDLGDRRRRRHDRPVPAHAPAREKVRSALLGPEISAGTAALR